MGKGKMGKGLHYFKVNTFKWYADGSKTAMKQVLECTGQEPSKYTLSLGSYSSVFQAEILAIERCIKIEAWKDTFKGVK